MKKKLMVFVLAVCLIMTAVVGMTGCNSKKSSELTFCESWDFESGFYPVGSPETQTTYGALSWVANFYETLVKYENGEFVPGLAESWTISTDGKTYTFKLRENVKFSDGSALTSEAVKKSIEVASNILGNYKDSYGALLSKIDEIICEDDNTVKFQLSNPYYGVLKDLTMITPMAIVNPAKINADNTPSDSFKNETHGTGPYMYVGNGNSSEYSFELNPHYWGEKPSVEKFKVKIIPDNNAKMLALKSGEIDVIYGTDKLSADAYNEAKSVSGLDATASEAINNTRVLTFNTSSVSMTGNADFKPVFNDIAVRDALSRAIDKDALCENLFSGLETKANTYFPKSYPYCNVDVTARQYNVNEAKTILTNAGWVDTNGDGIREKGGVKLSGSLVYNVNIALNSELALVIESQAKEIGIELIPKGLDMMGAYMELYGDFGVSISQSYGLTYDPCTTISNMANFMVDPGAAQMLNTLENCAELIAELNSTADLDRVNEIYTTILTAMNDTATFIPISDLKILAAYNTNIIENYGFSSSPYYIEVSKITLK